jgi:DNA-binding CsgD family transcriptional regulator
LEDDAFLLQVYRAARIGAADDFQRTVVALLRTQFPFGSMMWGNGLLMCDRSAVVPTALHKEGLDDEFLRRWAEEVAGDDPVIPLLARCPNCAHTIEVAQVYRRYPGLVEFGQEFGIESFTIIGGTGLEPEHTSWLCLYRQGSVARPTHAELRWLEAAAPHLAEAWRINAAIHSARHRSNPRSFALAEGATAKLLSSDDEFKVFLIAEWAEFDGHVVPRCLAQLWLDRDDIFFEGKNVRFHAKRVTNLVYLSASPVVRACDGLSPRLRQVAGLYVKGLSHKEIAQRIGISPATVRNQIAAAYAQLRIHTKIELLERLGDGSG